MRKKLLTAALLFSAITANAQVNVLLEDSKDTIVAETYSQETQSLNDVLKSQQKATNVSNNTEHFNSVWSRRKYVDFVYNNATATITEGIPSSEISAKDSKFNSDWGASFIVGVNYKLHKPIANMLTINLDFNCIELTANHYKKTGDGYNGYYPASGPEYKSNEKLMRPIDEEKYDFNYGMSLGPSITVAPFTHISSSGLHFFKFNVYFNVGYNAALLYYKVDDSKTQNLAATQLKKSSKLEFGHGLYTKFGFNLSWKVIGIGYEYRSGTNKYFSLSKDQFGDSKFKMKTGINRIYLQLRM